MLGPWIKVIGGGQTGDGKSEHRHFRNQWTKMDWMGEFNTDDHYIYYYGQESLRRNGVAIAVTKRAWNVDLEAISKWQNDLCSSPRQTIQYHSTPSQVPTSNTKEAEDLQDLLEWTPQRDVLVFIGDWNAEVESQEIPGVTG